MSTATCVCKCSGKTQSAASNFIRLASDADFYKSLYEILPLCNFGIFRGLISREKPLKEVLTSRRARKLKDIDYHEEKYPGAEFYAKHVISLPEKIDGGPAYSTVFSGPCQFGKKPLFCCAWALGPCTYDAGHQNELQLYGFTDAPTDLYFPSPEGLLFLKQKKRINNFGSIVTCNFCPDGSGVVLTSQHFWKVGYWDFLSGHFSTFSFRSVIKTKEDDRMNYPRQAYMTADKSGVVLVTNKSVFLKTIGDRNVETYFAYYTNKEKKDISATVDGRGKILAVVSVDMARVVLIDLSTGEIRSEFPIPGGLRDLDFSVCALNFDATKLFIGCGNGFCVLDCRTGCVNTTKTGLRVFYCKAITNDTFIFQDSEQVGFVDAYSGSWIRGFRRLLFGDDDPDYWLCTQELKFPETSARKR